MAFRLAAAKEDFLDFAYDRASAITVECALEAYVTPRGDLGIDPSGLANEVTPCP